MRGVRIAHKGRGLLGGGRKEWMGYLLGDFIVFGINVQQWSIITAAQGEGE